MGVACATPLRVADYPHINSMMVLWVLVERCRE